MTKEKYDKELIRWVKRHHWDSLENDKELIIRHLRTFTGDAPVLDDAQNTTDNSAMLQGLKSVIPKSFKHDTLMASPQYSGGQNTYEYNIYLSYSHD